MLFISYSRNNRKFAEQLHDKLKEAGFGAHQVFMDDDSRNGIPLGYDWEQELLANIQGVTVLIVLVSPAWFESKWCFAELALCKTRRHDVRIIPLVIEDLSNEQWILSGLGPQLRSNVIVGEYPTEGDAIAAFVDDLEERGIRPITIPGRLIESYPDANSYLHKSYDQWANDPNMRLPLIQDKDQQRSIEEIRSKLRGDAESRLFHLHIHGNSGIGKTRVVFEALQDERFRSKVLYYENPDRYDEDPYIRHLVKRETYNEAILVVDDCLRCSPNDLAKRLAPAQGRVQIVTMSFDTPSQAGSNSLELQPLGRTGIQQILESYLEENDRNAEQLASMCQGSARYAHLLGQAARSDRSILDVSDGRDLAERIIPCGAPRDSETANTRLAVARFLALFERFGAADPFEQELEEIAKIICQFHPRIGLGDVADTVKTLHQARILQGRSTYYFAVRLMAQELWCSWWSIYGEHWKRLMVLDLTDDLFQAWLRSLRNVHANSTSHRVAEWIMGWLERQSILGSQRTMEKDPHRAERELKRRQDLLSAIFDRVPQRALELIENDFCSHSSDESNRNFRLSHVEKFELNIRVQLNKPEPSPKAIELLWQIQHGREVNQRHQDAGRELGRQLAWYTKTNRLPAFYSGIVRFLRTKTNTNCNKEKIVALRIVFEAFQQTSEQSAEACDYACSLWNLGVDTLRRLENVESTKPLFSLAARCLQRFFSYPDRAEDWVDELKWVAHRELDTRALFLSEIECLWTHPNEYVKDIRVRCSLKRLYQLVLGETQEARCETIFLTNPYAFSQEDVEQLESLYPRSSELQSTCESIAMSPSDFDSLLFRAVQGKSNFFDHGNRLAQADSSREAFRFILSIYSRNPNGKNITLILGYLDAIYNQDRSIVQNLVRASLEISWQSEDRLRLCIFLEIDSESFETELLSLVKNATIHRQFFWHLSKERIAAISEPLMLKIIDECNERRTIAALQSAAFLFYERFHHEKELSDVALKRLQDIVLSDALFCSQEIVDQQQLNMCQWKQCFEIQARAAPCVCAQFAKHFWKFYLESDNGMIGQISEAMVDAMEIAIRENPVGTWDVFFEMLETSNVKDQYSLIDWLLKSRHVYIEPNAGMWLKVPSDRLFAWADEQRDSRLSMIASRIPPLVVGDTVVSVTRDFLLKYGDHYSELEENWKHTRFGFYCVPNLTELQAAIATMTQLRDAEMNPRVTRLLDREIRHLSQLQERTKEQEEIDRERLRY